LLEPYPVTMAIAQNHPDIFDERKGTCVNTNTFAIREKDKLGLDMPVIEKGKVKKFLDGKPEVMIEDLEEGQILYLDENMYPASKGAKTNRSGYLSRTYGYRSRVDPGDWPMWWNHCEYVRYDKACVNVSFLRNGEVSVCPDVSLNDMTSNVRLPLVKIR